MIRAASRVAVVPAPVLALAVVLASAVGPALAPGAQAQQTCVLVISGLGGSEEHGSRFHEWSLGILAAAERAGIDAGNVVYLAESPDRDVTRIDGRSTREEVKRAIGELGTRCGEDDQLWIVAIGHGSAGGGSPRLNLPGPDMTAAEYAAVLAPVRAEVAFVNTASASGAFIPELSARGRALVTATKSGGQGNETIFAEFFSRALAGEADFNKDGRTSLLEAFDYARTEVGKYYEAEGLLKTEHALLDDNGDAVGSHEPPLLGGGEVVEDGQLASRLYFGGLEAELGEVEPSPELTELLKQKRTLERRVGELRLQKDSLPEELYLEELESLLVELALKDEEIRALQGADAASGPASESESASESASEPVPDPGAESGPEPESMPRSETPPDADERTGAEPPAAEPVP